MEGDDSTGSGESFKRRAGRKRPSGGFGRLHQSEIRDNIYFPVASSTVFRRFINRFSTLSLADTDMRRVFYRLALILCAAVSVPTLAAGQSATSRVLFRVFLSDGRVLSSYGEWSRLDDRVIFSMPTQLTHEPIELKLVTIPSQRVDWPRTESYAESVRAAAYAANRGDADFVAFSSEVAKVLNDVAKIKDPTARLA